jgi:hypothetical protein
VNVLLSVGDPGFPVGVSTGGIIGILLLNLAALVRGWVLLPREGDDCREAVIEQKKINAALERDRDDWKAIALGTTDPLKALARAAKETR